MGLHLIFGKKEADEIPSVSGRVKMFLSSFLVGITNPVAILTFLFAFSYFGISGETNFLQGMWLVVGVFLGTYLWWGILTAAVNIMKSRQKKDHFITMNRLFGVILCLFGLVIFIWYYFDIQLRQILAYWILGMVIDSLVSLFAKDKIHRLFVSMHGTGIGMVRIFLASALGILSPLCMYGTIPIAAFFYRQRRREDWLGSTKKM